MAGIAEVRWLIQGYSASWAAAVRPIEKMTPGCSGWRAKF